MTKSTTGRPSRALAGKMLARVLMATTAIGATAGLSQPALAQETHSYDIPAGELTDVLNRFARQAGIELAYDADLTSGRQSAGLKGSFAPTEGLARILSGTGITYRMTGPGSFTLERTPSAADAEDGAIQLGTLRVEGTSGDMRSSDGGSGYQGAPDSVYTTPGSVSAVSRAALRQAPARDTRDMLSGVAGVYSGEGNGSFPTVSPNIRGLQDSGRIVVSIDGARQNAQRGLGNGSSGYQSNSGQAFVDPAFVRMVEVDKNPGASAGSLGSLGGSVEFRTVGARDIIAPGRNYGFEIDATQGSNAYDMRASALASVRIADTGLSFTAGISKVELGEYRVGQHGGEVGASGNFKGRESWSTLAKLEGDFGDLTTSLSWMHQGYEFRYGSDTFSNRENVKNDSASARIEWKPDNPLIDLDATFWYNNSRTDELREERSFNGGAIVVAPETYIDLDTESFGGVLQNASRFDTGAGLVTLTYGVEAFRDDGSAEASSETIDQNPAWASRYIAFSPPGRRDVAGGFFNAEWSPFDFATLSAGLRYDWHRLKGTATYYNRDPATYVYAECQISQYDYILQTDPARAAALPPFIIPIFQSFCGEVYDGEFYREGSVISPLTVPVSYPGYDVEIDRSDSAWLPTLIAEFHPFDWLSPYVSYSESFRPPTVLETFFVGGPPADSVGINYAPNTALRPEKARTFEIGANIIQDGLFWARDSFRMKVAAFDRRIDDYVVLGYILTAEVPDRTYTSFVNLDGDTKMRGVELEGNYDARWFWFGGSAAWLDTKWPQSTEVFSNGTITTSGEIFAVPGNVPPKFQMTLDGGFRLFDERLEVGAKLDHVTPTLSRQLDDEGNLTEKTEPYTIIDLRASFRFDEYFSVRAAVTNLTDRNYVPGTSAYNAPGRTFLGSVNIRF